MNDRIEGILSKLPEGVVSRILENPSILDREIEQRRRFFPTKDAVPNVAQARALECYRQRHAVYGDYPKAMYFLAGNGVGKTVALVYLLAGVTLGLGFMNLQWFNYELFRESDELRKKRAIRIRIVCDGADMKQTGSLYQRIKEWIPTAEFGDRSSDGYYTLIKIPPPTENHKQTIIDIKTHNMALISHAGPDYDLVLFNEPPPSDVYSENQSRTRNGGRLAMFLTPLSVAAYLSNVVESDAPDGEMWVSNGSIWENCIDIPGMRGTLRRQDIESQIRQWEALDPDQVPARKDGKFMHLAGAIFSMFSEQHHVIPPMKIEQNWNGYCCIDPHPTKPAVIVWLALDPIGNWYVVAEYPTEQWNHLGPTRLTIRGFCVDKNGIERGANTAFPYMRNLNVLETFGDPNGMKAQQPHNRTSVKDQYEIDGGMDINIGIDNDIQLRHDKIRELLAFDQARKVDSINRPHLYVFNTCRNCIRALKNYSWKRNAGVTAGFSDNIDQTWKDFIDDIGYIVTTVDSWREVKGKNRLGSIDGDYAEILKGDMIDSADPNILSFAPTGYCGDKLW